MATLVGKHGQKGKKTKLMTFMVMPQKVIERMPDMWKISAVRYANTQK
jgi:hypothetical protein